ncbi:MAG: UDP-N-acetylmuramate--L-alanine ligase [Christensenellaceae bacterium]|jgi:UDP-N-acetylmuramate--alanine ligase|nr:UDP-N-acetylmuramate--L-alanine ligase [Christensenellaceae bacterium]
MTFFAGARFHFIGIGGISMSALAKILLSKGYKVSGSDLTQNAQTKELHAMGCPICIGHNAENVLGADFVIINGAIGAENKELAAARANNIPIIMRDKLLAEISNDYDKIIAVAGCHGKSTTTAMIGAIMTAGGFNPTIHNGALMRSHEVASVGDSQMRSNEIASGIPYGAVPFATLTNGVTEWSQMRSHEIESNLRLGGSTFFITEACEFKRSFLSLSPTLAVITNIDADHLDCYTDINDIKNAFAEFCDKTDIVVKNAEDANSNDIKGRKKTITFGINMGDVHTKNLRMGFDNKYSFEVILDEKKFGKLYNNFVIKLGVHGLHNVYNALGAIAAGLSFGADVRAITNAIQNYSGVARRFEHIVNIGNTPVILDYAHHPNEIKTTIKTADTLYQKYLLVFQPHTFTRTLAFFADFVSVLSKIKNLAIYKTYSAREKPIAGGRANDLYKVIKSSNPTAKYFANTTPLKKYIELTANKYDAIILCGAGDVVSGEFLTNEK